ncbi:MAG TPA: hypothetical protein IGS40_16080 [Trichormus sp. M33_DOE_039]|nr:hypothetical protein [Trichormus sp. M33_DOE_039]
MGESTAVSLSRRSRRHVLQVGKAAQRSVFPTDCLPYVPVADSPIFFAEFITHHMCLKFLK